MHALPFGIFRVEGSSMRPSLESGRYALVNKWHKGLKANDTIVFLGDGARLL